MKSLVLFAGIAQGLYCLLSFLTALFLVLLILIQRGRGGGLSGAFGGMGGQSAFGSKAGDTFTKITIIAATAWIILCLIGVKFIGKDYSVLGSASTPVTSIEAINPDLDATAEEAAGEATLRDEALGTGDAEPSGDGPSGVTAPAAGSEAAGSGAAGSEAADSEAADSEAADESAGSESG
jgi:preprotein translocase subunit SecG